VEHISRQPTLRILLVGLPMMLSEMVTELLATDTEIISVPKSEDPRVARELASGGYDLVIVELMMGGLPASLERFCTRDAGFPMLGISRTSLVLYEGNAPPRDLGDRPLSDVIAESRELALALRARRHN
jgi:hypothetical protein